jgi:putative ABC transport system ATP-binding protein
MIRVERLAKDYPMPGGTVRALHDVTFEIPTGSLAAVMGQSGSGKTTLLNLLGGLDGPTAGRYWLNGRDVSHFGVVEWSHERNRTIGFVFQAFNLLPTLSALGNVELPLVYRHVPPRQRRERARAVLDAMGLASRVHHRPPQLSGGQQQRVAIARALVGDPPLLLADEPTGNLDAETGEEILDLLVSLNRQGRTIVIVTHSAEVAARCQLVLQMRDGRMVSAADGGEARDLG